MWDAEQDHRSGREIIACWRGGRAENAESIAVRLQTTVQRLASLGLEAVELRPWTERRVIRTSDPTVTDLSIADLARLIDRKGRFDPPPLPAPVSAEGYSLLVSSTRPDDEVDRIRFTCHVAQLAPGSDNYVRLNLHGRNPIWGDEARCREMLRGLIEAWAPERAAIRTAGIFDHDAPHAWLRRYWMYWSKAEAESASFPECPPPVQPGETVEPWLGGQLEIWPYEGGLGAPGVWPS
jgi:hypothetical protein